MNENIIKTPEGKDLVLIERMTAAKRNAMRKVMLKGFNMDLKQEVKADARPGDPMSFKPEVKGFNFDVLTEEKEAAQIKAAVVSYDNITDPEKILAFLLESSPEEYDFVVAETEKVLSKVNFS